MGVGGRGASNLENKKVIVKFSGKEGAPPPPGRNGKQISDGQLCDVRRPSACPASVLSPVREGLALE